MRAMPTPSPLVNLRTLQLDDLLFIYNVAARKIGKPGVSAWLDVKLARARTERMVLEARCGVVTAVNAKGFAILKHPVRIVGGDARITLKRYDNPHPPGTNMAHRWAMVVDGGTIADYLKKRKHDYDGRREIQWWARKHDWLTVLNYVVET